MLLDLRVPGTAGPEAVLDSFDRLPEGGRLTLTMGACPRELLESLRAARPRLFDWWLLEDGPAAWRVQIVRRVADLGGPRGVPDFLETDHARLMSILNTSGALVAEGHAAEARGRLAEFAVGVERHIRSVEQIVIPRVSTFAGFIESEVVAHSRADHITLRETLRRLTDLVENGSDWTFASPFFIALLDGFIEHADAERRRLYPMVNDGLSDLDHDEVVRMMQSL